MRKELICLNNTGCDIVGSLGRFSNDEEFYLECYRKALNNVNFEKLGVAIKNHEKKNAFDASHDLKGMIANMGITPIYKLLEKIVEPLRPSTVSVDFDYLESIYEDLLIERKKFKDLVK